MIIVRTVDGCLERRGSLKDMEGILDKTRFYRCQNNLIVNLYKIVNIDSVHCRLIFEGNIEVDIPYRQIRNSKNAYVQKLKFEPLNDF
jgi:DNA-binding LytR/AlgR family response regulator